MSDDETSKSQVNQEDVEEAKNRIKEAHKMWKKDTAVSGMVACSSICLAYQALGGNVEELIENESRAH